MPRRPVSRRRRGLLQRRPAGIRAKPRHRAAHQRGGQPPKIRQPVADERDEAAGREWISHLQGIQCAVHFGLIDSGWPAEQPSSEEYGVDRWRLRHHPLDTSGRRDVPADVELDIGQIRGGNRGCLGGTHSLRCESEAPDQFERARGGCQGSDTLEGATAGHGATGTTCGRFGVHERRPLSIRDQNRNREEGTAL
jgi:hypothetical protein